MVPRPTARQNPRRSARTRILDAASVLFYQEGVQNVGVDRIIAESGVAKMSLYNHFKSKDALIAAYLQQRHEQWLAGFQSKVDALAMDPSDRILALFDILHEWFQEENFRGCAFVNSAVELANPDHPGYQISLRHRQAIADTISHWVSAAALPNAETLTQQLVILVDGATTAAMMGQGAGVAKQAKQIASVLLAHANHGD